MCVCLLVFGAACSGNDSGAPGAPEELTGVIVDLEGSGGFGEVTSFQLKSGADIYDIYIDPEIEYELPLAHLSEHLRASEPVTVTLTERDGKLYAQSITDA